MNIYSDCPFKICLKTAERISKISDKISKDINSFHMASQDFWNRILIFWKVLSLFPSRLIIQTSAVREA